MDDWRYLITMGFLFEPNFFARVIRREIFEDIDMNGAIVIRLQKPTPMLFITFGTSGFKAADAGCSKCTCTREPSDQEKFALGRFLTSVDPEAKFGLRVDWYFIDMIDSDAKIIRYPSKEEMAHMISVNKMLKKKQSMEKDLFGDDDSDAEDDIPWGKKVWEMTEEEVSQALKRANSCKNFPKPLLPMLRSKLMRSRRQCQSE